MPSGGKSYSKPPAGAKSSKKRVTSGAGSGASSTLPGYSTTASGNPSTGWQNQSKKASRSGSARGADAVKKARQK